MRRVLRAVLAALLVLSLAVGLTGCASGRGLQADLGTLTIHFLDVGQADAIVICCNDRTMLIDGGNAGDSRLIYSYLRNTLGVEQLDYIISTHPHEDHVGGLAGALNACTCAMLFSPVTEYDSRAFSSLIQYADRQGLTPVMPVMGETWALSTATFTFVGPVETEEASVNDLSLVVRLDFGERSFLFTGDMEAEGEERLLAAGADVRADVLKVGHHGSSTSSTQAFLQAVSPAYAVIQVGADNSYGHPHTGTLKRLSAVGARVYRTDQLGHIVCTSDGRTLTFITERH